MRDYSLPNPGSRFELHSPYGRPIQGQSGWAGPMYDIGLSQGYGGAELLAPDYHFPYPFQVYYDENPHAAHVGGFGVGWNPFADARQAYRDFLREHGVYYVEDPEAQVVIPMTDVVGELYRDLEKMGAAAQGIGFQESVRQLQLRLGTEPTGALDANTLTALEGWGSSVPVMLVTALDILGTEASRDGYVHALMRLQNRYGLPETGALDAETARILRRQVYDPSTDELRAWFDLETAPSRREFYADPKGAWADIAEAAKKAAEAADPFAWFKRFVKRIGRDPVTYAGLAGSVMVGAVAPALPALKALAVVPLAGALLYELSDEISKDEKP